MAASRSGVSAGTAAASRRAVLADLSGVWRRKSCPQYALVMRTSAAISDSDLPDASLAVNSAATSFCLGMVAGEQAAAVLSMARPQGGSAVGEGRRHEGSGWEEWLGTDQG